MKTEARFDARLSIEQKALFERAAVLGGYKTLSEFVIYAVQDKARQIIHEHENFLASERDREVFFNALINEIEPNDALKAAAKKYKEALR